MIKKISAAVLAAIVSTAAMAETKQLEISDISGATFATQMMPALTALDDGESYAKVSNDHMSVEKFAFKTGRLTGKLYDPATATGEKVGRIDSYQVSPDGQHLLLQTATSYIYRRSFTATYYVYDMRTRRTTLLSTAGAQQVPLFSPKGDKVAFVRDNNIYLADLASGTERQLTTDGRRNEVINGIPDWVNEEEFGFNRAMEFTADGRGLVWVRYDESRVSEYPLLFFKGASPAMEQYAAYPGVEPYKYPKAGEVNSTVTVHSYSIADGATRQLSVPLHADGYIPRIAPVPGSGDIMVFTLNRHQDSLDIYKVDAISGSLARVVQDVTEKYVQEAAVRQTQIGARTLVLPSERSGYMQLYVYDMQGRLLRHVGQKEMGVTEVYGYDEKTGSIYFAAQGRGPLGQQVYVSDARSRLTMLSDADGWTDATFAHGYRYLITQWSDATHPYVFKLRDARGRVVRELIDNERVLALTREYGFQKPEFFTFTTSEGVELNGYMVRPADFNPRKRYPVVMYQYGGPGSQQVRDRWSIGSCGSGARFEQMLAQRGYIAVVVDGRGTGGRGADFEKCTYLRLGEKEAADQVETALWLGSQPYVDKDRIGIWGWSYGGWNTLMSMSEGRPVFAAGVAVAPPTNWRYYDTVYTERYMRTPQENPEGYDAISVIGRVRNLHGSLLLVHGLADDNVHYQNTAEYVEALVQADKDFRQLVYTNRNHSIYGGNTRTHLYRQIMAHFDSVLK